MSVIWRTLFQHFSHYFFPCSRPACLICGICFFALSLVQPDLTATLILINLASAAKGGLAAGVYPMYMDLAHNYVGENSRFFFSESQRSLGDWGTCAFWKRCDSRGKFNVLSGNQDEWKPVVGFLSFAPDPAFLQCPRENIENEAQYFGGAGFYPDKEIIDDYFSTSGNLNGVIGSAWNVCAVLAPQISGLIIKDVSSVERESFYEVSWNQKEAWSA